MRLLVVASCVVVATTAPALACPRALMCLVAPERTAPEVSHATNEPAAIPDVRQVKLAPRPHLTFDAPRKRDPNELELPWIWRVLREQVYSQMPTHRAQTVVLRLSPVVVTTPAETVPGLGIAGDF